MNEACSIVETDCEAPPTGVNRTGCMCFRCGLPVCRKCSVRVEYLRYGVKRLCLPCLEEHREDERRVKR